jgi:hypothetical protein
MKRAVIRMFEPCSEKIPVKIKVRRDIYDELINYSGMLHIDSKVFELYGLPLELDEYMMMPYEICYTYNNPA